MPGVVRHEFTNALNYTTSNAEVIGGRGKPTLVDKPSQVLNQPFTSDAGFTYDALKAEFTGSLVRSIDQTPSDALFASKYDSTINLNWHKSGGSLTGVANGSPTVVGGKLVCTGSQGVYYARPAIPISTHRFRYTPNYTGAPPANVNLVSMWNGTNNNDRFDLTHSPSGNTLRVTLYNSTGSVVISVATAVGGAWSPTAGVEYEFEMIVDATTGVVRIFVNGVLHGTNSPGPWTKGVVSTRLYIGASPSIYNRAEGSFDDYIVFNTAKHTTSYTPGYTVAPFLYATNKVDLPALAYPGSLQGSFRALTGLALTSTGNEQFIVEGLYHNGSAWVVSDGSFAQSNPLATVLANFPALDVIDETEISISIVFPDSNTQGSVDDLTLTYTGQQFPLAPHILGNQVAVFKEGVGFTSEEIAAAGSTLKYVQCVDGVEMYHNGSAWVEAPAIPDPAFANTAAEADAAYDSLVAISSNIRPRVVWDVSDQDADQAEIDTVELSGNAGQIKPTDAARCEVGFYVTDTEGNPVPNAQIIVKMAKSGAIKTAGPGFSVLDIGTQTADANGFKLLNLIRSSAFEGTGVYTYEYRSADGTTEIRKTAKFDVPDQSSANIDDLVVGK